MIRGAKAALRPIVAEDVAPLFRWLNDVETVQMEMPYRPIDGVAARTWLDGILRDATKIIFAIAKPDTGEIIGYLLIGNINPVYRSAEIGIRIGEAANRGLGFGRDALGLALDFCWRNLNLMRVALSTPANNARAIRAYQAVGFKREGRLRRAAFLAGEWVDLVLMGALRPSDAKLAKTGGRRQTSAAETDDAAPRRTGTM